MFALSGGERRLVAEAAVLSAVVSLAIRLRTVRALLAWLDRLPASRLTIDRRRAAALVEAVTARVPGATCLTRALVLYGVLGRRGAAPVFVLGTRRDDDALRAHAWLQCDGDVLAGAFTHESFATLWQWAGPRPGGAPA